MTANQVIAYVDGVKPNVYSDEDKYQWISTLERMAANEVRHVQVKISLPDDADRELAVPAPYDDLYSLYVEAMIDFHNREYNNYNNTVLLFKERLEQYKAWYIQNNPRCGARNFRNVMG